MKSDELQLPQSAGELSRDLSGMFTANPNRTDQKVWAVYVRISREDKRRYQYSKDTQPDEAEAYARKHGSGTVVIYKDWDYSGKNSKRPEFQRLRKDIIAGRVDVLVIPRLDRLYRNLESQLRYIRFLKNYNVELVSLTERIEMHTWWGRLVLYVLGALAEMYIWQTSERTRTALTARLRSGLPNGDLLLGYCNGLCSTCTDPNGGAYCPLLGGPDRADSQRGRIAVPHPVDRYAAVWIHNSYSQGMSDKEIADYLNYHDFILPDGTRVHFRTRGQKRERKLPLVEQNRRFKRDSIRAIVRNPFYAGMVARYPRPDFSLEDNLNHPDQIRAPRPAQNQREIQEMHPGLHQPLIALSLWKENQAQREGRYRTPNSQKRKARVYALTGVGHCWECYDQEQRLETLRGSSDKGKQQYRCAMTLKSVKRNALNTPDAPRLSSESLAMEAHSIPGKNKVVKRHKLLRAEKLELQADQWMSRLVIPPDWHDWIAAYYLSDDGMAEFEYEGHNLRQAMDRYQQLYLAGRVSKAELDVQTQHLSRQLERLRPSVQREAAEIQPFLSDFSAIWSQMTNAERRRMLGLLFAGLYFDREGELRKIAAHSPFDSLLGLPEGGAILER